jgi:hypothetical protein
VQLGSEATGADALTAAGGTSPRTVVFRVPLPRVQTALRFLPLEDGVPVVAALDNARVRAEQAAAADARQPGRAGAVAAAEARALADPAGRCVLALLVDGDRAALAALPEQTARADPPPDDGPVPTAP